MNSKTIKKRYGNWLTGVITAASLTLTSCVTPPATYYAQRHGIQQRAPHDIRQVNTCQALPYDVLQAIRQASKLEGIRFIRNGPIIQVMPEQYR